VNFKKVLCFISQNFLV